MKTYLLLLFSAIIALSEAVPKNLRFLRSIPNRVNRRSPVNKNLTRDDFLEFEIKNLIPDMPMHEADLTQSGYAILANIFDFFEENIALYKQLVKMLLNSYQNALRFCKSLNGFSEATCVFYLKYVTEVLKDLNLI